MLTSRSRSVRWALGVGAVAALAVPGLTAANATPTSVTATGAYAGAGTSTYDVDTTQPVALQGKNGVDCSLPANEDAPAVLSRSVSITYTIAPDLLLRAHLGFPDVGRFPKADNTGWWPAGHVTYPSPGGTDQVVVIPADTDTGNQEFRGWKCRDAELVPGTTNSYQLRYDIVSAGSPLPHPGYTNEVIGFIPLSNVD
ncbi:hypothetical protein GCM10022215_18560 [Nocardioides fonticola]|uniref:Uncharacterized protein n=1 Tax=Nocardioides fonticola TaxID=450363 RepID=A0ABP7XIE4_9ACTN